MGSSKSSSSDENDGDKVGAKSEDDAGAGAGARKRSYECTFCKRGFTNAQALGGHMNIHRKDRAKTKQLTPGSSSSLVSLKPNMNPNFVGRVVSGQTMDFYPVFDPQSYLQQKNAGHGNDEFGLIHDQGNDQPDERVWGENLSLQVGSNHNVEIEKEDDLDLELRLGRDWYSR